MIISDQINNFKLWATADVWWVKILPLKCISFKTVSFISVLQVPQFSRVFCPKNLFSPKFLCKNWIEQNTRLDSEDWVDDPCWRTHPCSPYYTVELKLGFGVITLLDLQGEIDHNTWLNKRNSAPVDSVAAGWNSLTIVILKLWLCVVVTLNSKLKRAANSTCGNSCRKKNSRRCCRQDTTHRKQTVCPKVSAWQHVEYRLLDYQC